MEVLGWILTILGSVGLTLDILISIYFFKEGLDWERIFLIGSVSLVILEGGIILLLL